MLKIYHNDRQAIIADDYHKTYKETTKQQAITVSKAIDSKTFWYETLENRRNTLINSGYTRIA